MPLRHHLCLIQGVNTQTSCAWGLEAWPKTILRLRLPTPTRQNWTTGSPRRGPSRSQNSVIIRVCTQMLRKRPGLNTKQMTIWGHCLGHRLLQEFRNESGHNGIRHVTKQVWPSSTTCCHGLPYQKTAWPRPPGRKTASPDDVCSPIVPIVGGRGSEAPALTGDIRCSCNLPTREISRCGSPSRAERATRSGRPCTSA